MSDYESQDYGELLCRGHHLALAAKTLIWEHSAAPIDICLGRPRARKPHSASGGNIDY